MKKIGIVFLTLSLSFTTFSCRVPMVPAPFVGFSIHDNNWADTMKVGNLSVKPSSSSIYIQSIVGVSSLINGNLNASFDSKPDITNPIYSPEEQFAMGKIRERTQVLIEYYENNIAPVDYSMQHFTNIYLREKPKAYADKKLFGKESGEDLTPFFMYVGHKMKCLGPDYSVGEDLPQPVPPFELPLGDFFTPGTMMPSMFHLRSLTIPKELSEDDDITLTFIFPVTIEHYWSWLLELYENPDAEESFTDTEMVLKVSLKDLKVKGEIVQAS